MAVLLCAALRISFAFLVLFFGFISEICIFLLGPAETCLGLFLFFFLLCRMFFGSVCQIFGHCLGRLLFFFRQSSPGMVFHDSSS